MTWLKSSAPSCKAPPSLGRDWTCGACRAVLSVSVLAMTCSAMRNTALYAGLTSSPAVGVSRARGWRWGRLLVTPQCSICPRGRNDPSVLSKFIQEQVLKLEILFSHFVYFPQICSLWVLCVCALDEPGRLLHNRCTFMYVLGVAASSKRKLKIWGVIK